MAKLEDFKITSNTSQLIQEGTQLLEQFLNDYQFNEESDDFINFINVGLPIMEVKHHETWRFICENPEIFNPIIDTLGGIVEGALDLNETVFRRPKYVWIKQID
jgi:hypothetical protein